MRAEFYDYQNTEKAFRKKFLWVFLEIPFLVIHLCCRRNSSKSDNIVFNLISQKITNKSINKHKPFLYFHDGIYVFFPHFAITNKKKRVATVFLCPLLKIKLIRKCRKSPFVACYPNEKFMRISTHVEGKSFGALRQDVFSRRLFLWSRKTLQTSRATCW